MNDGTRRFFHGDKAKFVVLKIIHPRYTFLTIIITINPVKTNNVFYWEPIVFWTLSIVLIYLFTVDTLQVSNSGSSKRTVIEHRDLRGSLTNTLASSLQFIQVNKYCKSKCMCACVQFRYYEYVNCLQQEWLMRIIAFHFHLIHFLRRL